jgi:membrane protease YdiL (CAAX protease family)
MKRCDYCGKESEDAAEICHGCATPFPKVPAPTCQVADVPPIIPKPALNAKSATLIFIFMFVAQILGAMVGGAVVVAIAATHGLDLTDKLRITKLVNSSPVTITAAMLAGAIATLMGSICLVRPALKDTSPTGAAWVLGSRRELLKGLGLGLVVALGSALINGVLSIAIHPRFGPLTTMALTPGICQITYAILAVLVVPAPEEFLFRGVMYGGYLQSFGTRKAIIITSAIFVLMHASELIHFLPAALGILGLALTALYMRIRASAIGPAIAVHVGYNFVVVALSILYSLVFQSR